MSSFILFLSIYFTEDTLIFISRVTQFPLANLFICYLIIILPLPEGGTKIKQKKKAAIGLYIKQFLYMGWIEVETGEHWEKGETSWWQLIWSSIFPITIRHKLWGLTVFDYENLTTELHATNYMTNFTWSKYLRECYRFLCHSLHISFSQANNFCVWGENDIYKLYGNG